jgi:hypothetical protein
VFGDIATPLPIAVGLLYALSSRAISRFSIFVLVLVMTYYFL